MPSSLTLSRALGVAALATVIVLAACEGQQNGARGKGPVVITSLVRLASGTGVSMQELNAAPVVISQMFTGNGASNAFGNDWVELHNNTGTALGLGGTTLQYGTQAGTTWASKVSLPSNAVIAAGGYYLVQLGNATTGVQISADYVAATGIAASATSGKMAFVASSATMGATACPDATVVDFIGYGTANCAEGAMSAPALSSTTALQRLDNGGDGDRCRRSPRRGRGGSRCGHRALQPHHGRQRVQLLVD